jgi:hypothetical protein
MGRILDEEESKQFFKCLPISTQRRNLMGDEVSQVHFATASSPPT